MFTFGMQKTINRGNFRNIPRKDQDSFLQYLYDEGYSINDIHKEYDIPKATLYTRINANRGKHSLSV